MTMPASAARPLNAKLERREQEVERNAEKGNQQAVAVVEAIARRSPCCRLPTNPAGQEAAVAHRVAGHLQRVDLERRQNQRGGDQPRVRPSRRDRGVGVWGGALPSPGSERPPRRSASCTPPTRGRSPRPTARPPTTRFRGGRVRYAIVIAAPAATVAARPSQNQARVPERMRSHRDRSRAGLPSGRQPRHGAQSYHSLGPMSPVRSRADRMTVAMAHEIKQGSSRRDHHHQPVRGQARRGTGSTPTRCCATIGSASAAGTSACWAAPRCSPGAPSSASSATARKWRSSPWPMPSARATSARATTAIRPSCWRSAR